jgi:hypothetical protein
MSAKLSGRVSEAMATDYPVLYLTQEALFTWEQHAPGAA